MSQLSDITTGWKIRASDAFYKQQLASGSIFQLTQSCKCVYLILYINLFPQLGISCVPYNVYVTDEIRYLNNKLTEGIHVY
ncbi:hypothetical protein BCR43DRAFT_482451 [Syncephalastrum racemosum]|uniref:Uncharacterized protein n=1 Tax=Syncephalastrum racemosum TaxID=13706 RepID=A0A1X2HTN1_SYNRA|nr:hypothetical protein BCR43DRAFT_482451 [Syncephalastrum racemosum]